MPHYHFDLYNDEVAVDDEGRELPDRAAAHRVAVLEAREMMAASIKTGSLNLGHRIDVRDRTGVIESVTFGDAVRVIDQTDPA